VAEQDERLERYDPTEIEPRWQRRWEELGLHTTDLTDTSKPNYYLLTMWPYPSGDLHIGHWYVKTPTDAIARYKRMQGFNVFYPVGFDAFGLPAENAAIKRKIHPREWTYANMENMRRQLRSMGASFDWKSEVVTCDPVYFRWNQWIFLKFYEKGVAYRKQAPVDWCPSCQVTLAREQVEGVDRICWRCSTPVTKRDLAQPSWCSHQSMSSSRPSPHQSSAPPLPPTSRRRSARPKSIDSPPPKRRVALPPVRSRSTR
jgi:leucyl-tRNA synthetase